MILDNMIRQYTPWGKQSVRFIDYVFIKNINKILLRIRKLPEYDKENITVAIPLRNRVDQRLTNSLRSIRSQDYNQDLINITLVDYGSIKEIIPKYYKLSMEYDAEYIRIDSRTAWCRSHALNIAIKKATTKYTLSTDADIIFENNYFKEAHKELLRDPYQYIVARCLDAPINTLRETDYYKLKAISSYRFSRVSKGINMSLTHFYREINGYDEQYIEWGFEDEDLIKRFMLLGLMKRDISNRTSYIHQWHPKYWQTTNYEQIERNKAYFTSSYSIIRNRGGWGEIK